MNYCCVTSASALKVPVRTGLFNSVDLARGCPSLSQGASLWRICFWSALCSFSRWSWFGVLPQTAGDEFCEPYAGLSLLGGARAGRGKVDSSDAEEHRSFYASQKDSQLQLSLCWSVVASAGGSRLMKSLTQRCMCNSREIFANIIKVGIQFQAFIGLDCIDDLRCIFSS